MIGAPPIANGKPLSRFLALWNRFRHSAGAKVTTVAYAAIALLMVGPIILAGPTSPEIDYYYFWAAGGMWMDWQSPYSPAYTDLVGSVPPLHSAQDIRPFFYPPNTILLFAPLGLFEYKEAWFLASAMNLSALGLSSVLFARLTRHLGFTDTVLFPALLHFSFICIGWSIGKILFIFAQPMPVIYLGFLLVVLGALEKRTIWTTAGLVLCLLKPNIGLPVAFACLLVRQSREAAVIAGATTGALSLVGLAPGGILSSLRGFFENLALYAHFPENFPSHMSGMNFIAYNVFGADISAFVWLGASIAVVAAAWIADRHSTFDHHQNTDLVIFAMTTALFFLPGHNNYFIPATALIVWLARKPDHFFVAALAGFVLITQAFGATHALHQSGVDDPVTYLAAMTTAGISLIFATHLSRRFEWSRPALKRSIGRDPDRASGPG